MSVENKFMVTGGSGGRIYREIGIDIYILPYIT